LVIATRSLVEVTSPPRINGSGASWNHVAEQIANERNSQTLEAYFLSLPTERTPDFDSLRDYALESFADQRPIYEAVDELMARIHRDFEFDPSATTVHTSAVGLLSLRRGVCQDFTHFAIGCLRVLGLGA